MRQFSLIVWVGLTLSSFGAAQGPQTAPATKIAPPPVDARGVYRGPESRAACAYRFTPQDEALLDEIEFGCFQYFWKEVGSPACLAKDRLLGPVASIAAVGYQLSALPIGVERHWIPRAAGVTRATTVLKALLARTDNNKWGMYLHFPDMNDAGPSHAGYESEASTVDTALLLCGAITAAQYFGGEVATLTDRFLAAADWKRFAVADKGRISMAWQPQPKGPELGEHGDFIKSAWWMNSDEERLVYLLAVAAPTPGHAVDPAVYYGLERPLKSWPGQKPFVVSWPGSLFTYFISHCWVDYRGLGPDVPQIFGSDAPPVDWFENSYRAVVAHRQRCIEAGVKFKTLSAERWGLSACDGRDGYLVPEVQPNGSNHDDFCKGTVAPYAAGAAIVFTPEYSLAALREFRNLRQKPDGTYGTSGMGELFAWRDPAKGGYGLIDAFNLDQNFASRDYIGIDHGPLLLLIENARTGLIWKLFMAHPNVRFGMERLRMKPVSEAAPASR